jgi:hypothetical protein
MLDKLGFRGIGPRFRRQRRIERAAGRRLREPYREYGDLVHFLPVQQTDQGGDDCGENEQTVEI